MHLQKHEGPPFRAMSLTRLSDGLTVETRKRSELAGFFDLLRKMPGGLSFPEIRRSPSIERAEYEFHVEDGQGRVLEHSLFYIDHTG